ncbi:MAG TPA: maleylacetoacetate isomerase [Rhizomicrobium sp.]|nr:maleylacetoacetate isomerase [Rhizomicrobium sp.]
MSLDPEIVLYTYFRSSAAYRVRIALNLKGIKSESIYVHLLKDGGQQHSEDYLKHNPQGLVPTLRHNEYDIGQSLAILEYLEEVFPEPSLLPGDVYGRARARQLAYVVACDIHPLNNLRMLQRLRDEYGLDEAARQDWQQHWIKLGFIALEKMLVGSKHTGKFCHGDTPTIADICLIPQMFNARRVELDLTPYPTLRRIDEAANTLPAFADAAPMVQPDAG